MATYAKGLAVNAAINATTTGVNNSYSAAIYTAPITGYAIVRVSWNGIGNSPTSVGVGLGTAGNIRAVGTSAFSGGSITAASGEGMSAPGGTSTALAAVNSGYPISGNIYVGPGQSVYGWYAGINATGTVFQVVGVEFINTP
jgi:hypothetical protein